MISKGFHSPLRVFLGKKIAEGIQESENIKTG